MDGTPAEVRLLAEYTVNSPVAKTLADELKRVWQLVSLVCCGHENKFEKRQLQHPMHPELKVYQFTHVACDMKHWDDDVQQKINHTFDILTGDYSREIIELKRDNTTLRHFAIATLCKQPCAIERTFGGGNVYTGTDKWIKIGVLQSNGVASDGLCKRSQQ